MPKGFQKVSDSIKIQRERQNSRARDEVTETPEYSMSTYDTRRTSTKMKKYVLLKQRGHILTMQCLDGSSSAATLNSTTASHRRQSYTPSSTESERVAPSKLLENYFADDDDEISQEGRPKKKKVKLSASNLCTHNLKLAESKNAKPKKVKSAIKKVEDPKENPGTYKEEPLKRNLRERRVVNYNDDLVIERRLLHTVRQNQIVPKKKLQNSNKDAYDTSPARYEEIGPLPSREQSSANMERLLSRSMCFDEAPVEPLNKKGKKSTKAQSRVKSDEPDSKATTEVVEPMSTNTELRRQRGSKVNEIASKLARKRESRVIGDDDFEISTKRLDKLRALKGASPKNIKSHDLNLSKESFFEGSTVPEAEPAVIQEPPKKRRGRLPKAANKPKQSQNVAEASGNTKTSDVGSTPKTGTRRKSSTTNSHLRSSFFPRRKFYYPTENGMETIRFAGFYKPPRDEDEDRISVSALTRAKVGHVGYLHIPAGQSKPATLAKTNLFYNSLKGEGEVTIHNKKAIVKAPKVFAVPKGAFYSISNTGDIMFSLFFVIDNEN